MKLFHDMRMNLSFFTICSPLKRIDLEKLIVYFFHNQTPKQDLNSKFGMDLKRAMLLRLARKDTDLFPDDAARKEKIYNRYKVSLSDAMTFYLLVCL